MDLSFQQHKMNNDLKKVTAVKRINGCVDFYEILGVRKNAADSEIKASFKKLALLVHPDKISMEGALEAFKKISAAFATLIDPKKRRKYDMFVENKIKMKSENVHHDKSTIYHSGVFDYDDDTVEGLFCTIFCQSCAYIISIVILLLPPILSAFFISEPLYSLLWDSEFQIERNTENLRVPYFVKKTFQKEFEGSVKDLERSVEEEYLAGLRHTCYKEKKTRDKLILKAQSKRDLSLVASARNIELTSCDYLARLLKSSSTPDVADNRNPTA